MANVARPEEVRRGKNSASVLLTTLLLKRHRSKGSKNSKAQDLQEIYKVADSHGSSAMGDYWLKLVRGEKSLGDDVLARVAHQAFFLRQITVDDFVPLEFAEGGPRLLRMIGNLLIKTHGGAELGEDAVNANLAAWEAQRMQIHDRRAAERKALRTRLVAAKNQVNSTLKAVNELIEEMAASEHFDIPYRPADAPLGTFDEAQYVGPAGQFIGIITSLRASLTEAAPSIASVRVTERHFGGYADVPCIEPQGAAELEKLESLHDPLLRALERAWERDDDEVEVFVEELGDCLQILPPGSVANLCWTRRSVDAKLSSEPGASLATGHP